MELGGGYTVDVCLGIPRMHPNESNGWLMVNIICTWWICKIDGSFLQGFFCTLRFVFQHYFQPLSYGASSVIPHVNESFK